MVDKASRFFHSIWSRSGCYFLSTWQASGPRVVFGPKNIVSAVFWEWAALWGRCPWHVPSLSTNALSDPPPDENGTPCYLSNVTKLSKIMSYHGIILKFGMRLCADSAESHVKFYNDRVDITRNIVVFNLAQFGGFILWWASVQNCRTTVRPLVNATIYGCMSRCRPGTPHASLPSRFYQALRSRLASRLKDVSWTGRPRGHHPWCPLSDGLITSSPQSVQ